MPANTFALPQLTTTTATPVFGGILTVPAAGLARLDVLVAARAASGDMSVWRLERSAKRIGTAAPVFIGTAPAAIRENDVGAAAWALVVALSGNVIGIQATGAVGVTIFWRATGRVLTTT